MYFLILDGSEVVVVVESVAVVVPVSVVTSVDPVPGDVDSVVVVVVVVLLLPPHLLSPLIHPKQELSRESHC